MTFPLATNFAQTELKILVLEVILCFTAKQEVKLDQMSPALITSLNFNKLENRS